MGMTDPIADLLTRIRNASRDGLPLTTIPYSKVKEGIVTILCKSGYLKNYEVVGDGAKKSIVVTLKFLDDGTRVISEMKRISKPGCRTYESCDDIRPVRKGLGLSILSTSKGLLTDTQARQNRVGGEVICHIW
ncbi:30S ribosomal protein S8 [bacterium]|nr:30S ribosomal protein S8 [bacterium]